MEDKIERALKELLITHDNVTLPGFGTFKATDIPAMVDTQNNVIYPPRRKVNYDPDLKQDDGVLCAFYARQERISKDTAGEHITEFVEEINHKLHRGNPWVISELGKFIIDGLDNLNFFPDPDQNFVPQSYGLPDIEITGAKPEYPEIEVPDPVFSPEEEKKGKKEKKKKEKTGKKRSRKGIFFLFLILILGGSGYFYLFQTEMGQKQLEAFMHNAEEKPTKAQEPKKPAVKGEPTPAAVADLAPDSLSKDSLPLADSTKQIASEEPKKVEPKKEEIKKESAPKSANKSYQPRNGQTSFDVPDRLDIEATKMDRFVKDNKSGVPAENKGNTTKNLAANKPAVVTPKKEEKKAEPKKKEPVKTVSKAAVANKADNKKAEDKKVNNSVADVKKSSAKPAVEPVKPESKKPDDEVSPNARAIRSNESIYSAFQVVASEHRSIEEAVENSDRYAKMGYNVAVIQFKDGRFGVCVARSSDRIKAERYLRDVRAVIPSAKMKDY